MTGIGEFIEAQGITRLCHLTPYENLLQIATGHGLVSTRSLLANQRAVFSQQDLDRLDGHEDHICCSIEYPNTWYLRQRRQRATPEQQLFPDWICLFIDASVLEGDGVLFSPRNAAAGFGAYLGEGVDALTGLYATRVHGAGGRLYGRDRKPRAVPTDDQAEVLVPKVIPLHLANQLAVRDEAQAARVDAHLDLLGVPADTFSIYVAPQLFETSLSNVLRAGRRPTETPWHPEQAHGAD